ncbi:MAG: ankyrin repeat domain-containing protein [Xenococcaceae cyanobacterium]
MNLISFYDELKQAIKNNDTKNLKILIERLAVRGIDLSSTYENLNFLVLAIQLNNLEIVNLLIEAKAKLNSIYDDLNPLALAVKSSNVEIVKLLIKAGADVNIQMEDERDTVLMLAASNGHFEIVKMLVEAGADVNIGDCYGAKAVAMAAMNGHEDVYNYLAPLTVPAYGLGQKLLEEALLKKRRRNEKGLWVYQPE